MSTFVPQPEGVKKILEIFRDQTQISDNAQLQQLYLQLENLQKHPEFNNYLAYIFSSCKDQSDNIRAQTGIQLKNNVKSDYENMHPTVRQYIKNQVLSTLGDNSKFIRSIVGTIITTIANQDQLSGWEPILKRLVELLDDQNPNVVDGAFNALSKICEDMPDSLNSTNAEILNVLIPKLISKFAHTNESFRKYALSSVNFFLCCMPLALKQHMERYLQGLFFLAEKDGNNLRQLVCQAFVTILEEGHTKYLENRMEAVIKYMIISSQDPDELVAQDACEFWSIYCHNGDCELLRKYLSPLVECLLKGMVYSEADIQIMGIEAEEDEPDKPQDIRPRFHQAKSASYGTGEDEGDWDDDDEEVEWNLRKCSAASLDALASTFKEDLIPIAIPLLLKQLRGEHWVQREAGILAFGAIGEGCYDGLEPHLKDFIPSLMELLRDKQPLVRSITCWTLSRYAQWVLDQNDNDACFKTLMGELSTGVLDRNKKVQEAACSAFATIEEEAGERLLPYLQDIINCLMQAFSRYQTKNILILYDAIGTLAEAVDSALNQPSYIEQIVPPILRKWETLTEDDRTLLALLECLASLVSALRSGFIAYAQPVFNGCLQIISRNLQLQKDAAQNHHIDQPDKDFTVCALDLLSSFASALEETAISALVGNSNILGCLFECTKDPHAEVRQSAFALLGDLVRSCLDHIHPQIKIFLQSATINLNPHNSSVCNNASWAIGEFAVHLGKNLLPYVEMIIHALIKVLNYHESRVLSNLQENIAITIGRVALACPEKVAPYLEQLGKQWLHHLGRIREDKQKVKSWEGLLALVEKNPQGILNHFPILCDSIARWQQPYCAPPSNEMKQHLKQLLHAYKANLGPKWQVVFGQCSGTLREYLTDNYGV